jgi:hypothetical protein
MLARFRTCLAKQNIANVQLQEANVLNLESLPAGWNNYDLIVSASMLEYVPREELVKALSQLRFYTREELQKALAAAGFQAFVFRKFPCSHFWLNLSSHVVESST